VRQIKTVIPFPVYNYRIYVIFTDDLKECAAGLKAQGMLAKDTDLESTGAFTIKFSNQSFTYLVYPIDASIDHITHEVYHAISNMFNWISSKPDEEIFAYTLGYVTKQVTDDQAKAIKKFKKELDKTDPVQ